MKNKEVTKVYFGHKNYFNKDRMTADIETEVKNGNVVIVSSDGLMNKSEHVGLGYFKNMYTRVA